MLYCFHVKGGWSSLFAACGKASTSELALSPPRLVRLPVTAHARRKTEADPDREMGSTDYVSYGLALVVLSGGVFGYIKKGASTSVRPD